MRRSERITSNVMCCGWIQTTGSTRINSSSIPSSHSPLQKRQDTTISMKIRPLLVILNFVYHTIMGRRMQYFEPHQTYGEWNSMIGQLFSGQSPYSRVVAVKMVKWEINIIALSGSTVSFQSRHRVIHLFTI